MPPRPSSARISYPGTATLSPTDGAKSPEGTPGGSVAASRDGADGAGAGRCASDLVAANCPGGGWMDMVTSGGDAGRGAILASGVESTPRTAGIQRDSR